MLIRTTSPPIRAGADNTGGRIGEVSPSYAITFRTFMNRHVVSARVNDYAGVLPPCFPQRKGGA